MKICLVNNIYKPYDRGGGAERITQIIAEEIKNIGHDVFVISTKPKNKKLQKNTKLEYNAYYLPSLFLSLNKMPKFFRLFWHILEIFSLGHYFKVKKIIKKENPDVIITNNLKGLGLLASLNFRNKKHIHILHDIQLLYPSGLMFYGQEKILQSFFSKIYQIIGKILLKPKLIISPSEWLLKTHLQNNFFKKTNYKILPNPAPTFSPKIKRKNDNAKKQLLYVGQIEKHKGFPFLINAFKKMANDNIEMTIIGQGSQLKNISGQEGQNLHFIGTKTNQEILQFMSQADFLVVSSLCYENSPTVIYEAASQQLPVIASRIGGITELIHHLGGILFGPGNEQDFIKKIEWALTHPEQIRKLEEKSKNIQNFSKDKYIKTLLNYIAEIS